MKKFYLLLIVIATFAAKANAQTLFFSTSYVTYCYWNSSTEKFEDCEGKEQTTLFKLNPDQTVFTHVTETITSSYFVSKNEYNAEYDVYTYEVTSDAGNSYTFIIDLKVDEIRIVGNNTDGPYLVTHTVKKAWKED